MKYFLFFIQKGVALSAVDSDHVCLCGSREIDGKLKGKKDVVG